MRRIKSALVCAALGASVVTAPCLAMQDADTEYSPLSQVERMAEILGAVHYHRFTCVDANDFVWRQQMEQLLALEAPEDSPRRQRLVRAFNTGFSTESDMRRGCADSVLRERELAQEGSQIANRLYNLYVQ